MAGITSDADLWELAHKIRLPIRWIGFKNETPTPVAGNYIINLASSTDGTGGTHWCAARLEGRGRTRKALYFDPFGMPPPRVVLKWLNQWIGSDHNKLVINLNTIQNLNSNWCGQYCIGCLEAMESCPGPLAKRLHHFISTFRTY